MEAIYLRMYLYSVKYGDHLLKDESMEYEELGPLT